jgi:hypothetical protein
MKKEKIEKIFSSKDSLLDSGLSIFIVTKHHRLMPYEVTYNTVYSDEKIFDEFWQIDIKDVECFEIV